MVVIQNIINDSNIDLDNLSLVCQKFMNESDIGESELLIRLVSPLEIQVLNKEYRSKNQVTNVLSFQSDVPEEVGEQILGDVVICVDVVREEALVGGKVFLDHLIHMAIHGILHLLGHDHSDLTSADKMELIEINFLDKIGIKNPYQ
ncbi:rRNA maturation RNase YbeY [Candidatus Thioglobus sp. NP1]|jgi:probable rRNA maturation factor|uniref:rRNA maturation RNase YbeY n=1 Tax=Candidatus Thioglobus sp. NP1 TaxID=2508687 RepID=UPI000DED5EB6|nr:rRNA maturation RNase YbeY [Candidatus Thioglobus sp. NP1]AXE61196.1 rRNA maturation RNase YbeY [Candidatus Thioglobus sp. NP1]